MNVTRTVSRIGVFTHVRTLEPTVIADLFPRLLGQSEYNARLKDLAPLMEAALRWLADHTPGSAELVRLMDATPVPCGHSVITARRSGLAGWAGYGYCPSHSRWYWGSKLLILCTCDGTVTGFGLANPKLYGERAQARQMLTDQPANRPPLGTAVVTDKGLSGEEAETFFAGDDLRLTLIRPARQDEEQARPFPNWLRQRVEAIIWTLKHQLGLERHGGRVPAGLWARIVQRLLALNACIWHNWTIGAPVKRSLIAYDH
ncbi:MAG: transposase [Streptosporangiaceae bacterium]